jgi:hypothetical protein
MSAGEEYRMGVRPDEDYATEARRNGSSPDGGDHQPNVREPLPRAVGAPLPMGTSAKPQALARSEGLSARANVPPPGRSLSAPAPSDPEASGVQWAMGFLKQVVPFVQKLLPLLDGQIATAAANVLARSHTPAPKVDLQPIENGLADLQLQQASFKDQLADHNASLKRVEDHLEMVREATDRNTLEQQELIEDLKSINSRINRFALLFLALLVISVLLNIFLFLHIQRVLP